jgi:hypothetical protein
MANAVSPVPTRRRLHGGHKGLASLSGTFRQRRLALGAISLYVFLAVVVMSPLASNLMPESQGNDLANHVSGIIEARNALAEGQFPIRVAPKQHREQRYPIFQFYGNFPYTVGGLLYLLTRQNPYVLWKQVVIGFLVVGGFFTYRCGRVLTRQALPSIVAGALFLTAPYMLTDIHGRFAFPEMVSFALLPVVFFYLIRSFVSRRPGYVLGSALAWSCLALSHNVTFLYGSIFYGLYVLSHTSLRKTYCKRLTRVGIGYLLGMFLTAWYFVPQAFLVPQLMISDLIPVQKWAWLTPLGVLLAPMVVPPVPLPHVLIDLPMHFGLQVGWPVLAAVGLLLYYLRKPPVPVLSGRRAIVRLLAFFLLALFMVWSPFDFWRFLPGLFSYVQFSYRLLMFVVLWGSLLAGFALAQLFKGRMRFEHLVVCLVLVGLCTTPYLSPQKASATVWVEQEIAHPDMGRGGSDLAYLLSPKSLVKTTWVGRDVNWAEWEYGFVDGAHRLYFPGEGEFPAPRRGDTLRIEGLVPERFRTPVTFTAIMNSRVMAVRSLPPGPFRLAIPIDTTFPTSRVTLALRTDRYLDPEIHGLMPLAPPKSLGLYVWTLKLDRHPAHADSTAVVIPQGSAPAGSGQPVNQTINTPVPCLAQLPVLYYPGMLRVLDNGRPIPYGNMGRHVALELQPGNHVVSVRFVGVRWANLLSLGSWLGVLVAVLVIVSGKWRRRELWIVPSIPINTTICSTGLKICMPQPSMKSS